MIVIYRNPNVLSVPQRIDPKDAGVVVGEGFDFKPGLNDVPTKIWDDICKNPLIKLRLEQGKLETVKGDKGESVEIKDLHKLPEDRAIKVVEQTHDEEVLGEIKNLDKRPKVQAAIKKQEKVLEEVATAKKG